MSGIHLCLPKIFFTTLSNRHFNQALQKERWIITDDPLKFKFGNVNFQVDLGAEQLVAAERAGEKIAVEIKSFLNPSAVTDFYSALGQFLSYRLALESIEPNRTLYLAIPIDVCQTFLSVRIHSSCGTTVSGLADCV